MDNPAQTTDLAARGYDGPASGEVQQTRLDEAWRALCREVPSIPTRIGTDLTSADVVDVICAATLRILRNPEGRKQESGGLDDYTETWQLADASSDLYFTAAEIRRLQPAADAILDGWSGSVRYC